MLANCLSCGKGYEMKYNEKLSDFQCECGGELSSEKFEAEPINTIISNNHRIFRDGKIMGIKNHNEDIQNKLI